MSKIISVDILNEVIKQINEKKQSKIDFSLPTTSKVISGAFSELLERKLDSLSDVDVEIIKDKQVLSYDATNKKWVPGASELSSDSSIIGLDDGKFLYNNNGKLGAKVLPSASLLGHGIVKLSSSVSDASEVLAATSSAVKSAYDLAVIAKSTADSALPKTGGTLTGEIASTGFNITNAPGGTAALKPGNGDNATIGSVSNNVSNGTANVKIDTWNGIGFSNTCAAGGPLGINLAIDARSGSIIGRGTASFNSNQSKFGSASGVWTNSTESKSNCNILLYDAGGENWAGLGTDASGSIHMRVGTSGNHAPQFKFDGTGTLTASKVFNAVYNDYAEYFEKDENESIEPGDVIVLGSDKYTKSTKEYQTTVVGVCSDTYGHLLGGKGNKDDEIHYTPIGLSGRVNVKLVGKISKGDLITTSSIEGVAMKAHQYFPGTIIGKAMEDKINENIDRISMLIMTI